MAAQIEYDFDEKGRVIRATVFDPDAGAATCTRYDVHGEVLGSDFSRDCNGPTPDDKAGPVGKPEDPTRAD